MYRNRRRVNFLTRTFFILLLTIISACSQVQNLSLSPQNGNCVQPSMYGAKESSAIANFPLIAKNPLHAPYCISLTINNPNSASQGGSVMQITYPGLVLTGLPNESSVPFSLIDPIASGESDAITNQSQTIGNIALFDPNSCATIGGANSNAIQGGQSCTFYLQITNESYAPNTYPLFLSYSFYNGNVTNSIIASIYEHVNLYAGTQNGLYEDLTSGVNNAQWVNNALNAPSGQINALITDDYGNIYFANGKQVYMYNGLTLMILGNALPTNINSLAFDVNGTLYAGTNGSGVYIYNTSISPSSWVSFTDTNGGLTSATTIYGITSSNFIPGVNTAQNLYVTTANEALQCSITPSTTILTSCAFTNISSAPGAPNSLNFNALDYSSSGLAVGSGAEVLSYIANQNLWQNLTFPNSTLTGNIAAVFNQTISSITYTYVGISNATTSNESAIFNCNSTSCSPAIRAGTVSVSGNVNSITTDGDGDLFIGGNTLNSSDFADTANMTGAYLYFTSGTNMWQAITTGSMPTNSNVNSMVISATLLGQ